MRNRSPLRGDRRAVSSTLGYVITLGISGILIVGLLTAGGTLVTNEREVVAREQLTVAGEQLATGMADADRLAATGDGGTIRVEVWLPDGAGSAPYSVRLVSQSTAAGEPNATKIVAESPALDVSESVVVRTTFEVADATIDGGPVVVTFDDDGNRKLHVQDARNAPAPDVADVLAAFSPSKLGSGSATAGGQT